MFETIMMTFELT